MFWKIPPRIKVYEALGCIADRHVVFISDNQATVLSSEGSRKYKVLFSGVSIASDDNGSKWRGYLGYPSIAVLMLRGLLPFNAGMAEALRGIKWYQLNKKFGNYDMTIKEAENVAAKRGIDLENLRKFVDSAMDEIKKKKFEIYVRSQKRLF